MESRILWCNAVFVCSLHVKKWSPYLSMGRPHVHVDGGGGCKGRRSFLWMKILNSSGENLLVASVRVD